MEESIYAAKGLSGYQFEAYFSIMSTNSNKHEILQPLGHSYGVINHLANDIMSNDPRYIDLDQKEKSSIRAWTMTHAKNIAEANITLLSSRLPSLLRYIR